MKTIVLDSSSIISLATNDLLWLLRDLKNFADVRFLIPENVKKELVDNPLNTKYYKLEAIMINNYISQGLLQVLSSRLHDQLPCTILSAPLCSVFSCPP